MFRSLLDHRFTACNYILKMRNCDQNLLWIDMISYIRTKKWVKFRIGFFIESYRFSKMALREEYLSYPHHLNCILFSEYNRPFRTLWADSIRHSDIYRFLYQLYFCFTFDKNCDFVALFERWWLLFQ